MEKPGYKTTEAWISLLSSVLLIAVSYGLLSQEQSDSLMGLVAPALPLLLSIVPTVIYTVQRTGLKKETVKAEAVKTAEKARAEAAVAMAQTAPLMAAAAPMAAQMYAAAPAAQMLHEG
jgi:alpha-beta hydrolase superfamily lysophospholipase